MSITYAAATSVVRGTILAFHGGCFVNGSVAHDVAQNKALALCGFNVIQVDFPKTWTAFVKWAEAFDCDCIKHRPVHVLGRSSGGFLAATFAQIHTDVSKVVLLAPVADPVKRMTLLPKFAKPTRAFFQKHVPKPLDLSELHAARPLLLLVLAHHDGNIPTELFSKQEQAAAFYPGPTSHAGLCTCASKKFIATVVCFLEQ